MVLTIPKKLTPALLNVFLDDKDELRLIVNTEKQKLYLIRKKSYHAEVASEILGVEESDIVKNPEIASHLVSSMIRIVNNKVDYVVTGMGSLELICKVKHTREQLQLAHELVIAFVNDGLLEIDETFRDNIVYKSLKK